MKTTRHIAAEVLMQVDMRGAWSNLALDNLLGKYELDSRESRFAGALVYGVLERRLTLDACIAAHSKQPLHKLSPAVLAALRLAVYQMLYMDSVPDHAAVSESVELVRHLRKAQATGFVNGVLRSFLRTEKTIPLPEKPLSARLSVEYACPEPLVALWLTGYGEEKTRRILAGSLGRPPIYLRANTLRISAKALAEKLAVRGITAAVDFDLPDCLVLEDGGAVHTLPEYRQGLFHVQDKASQLCAMALGAKPGMRVLDVCAAPGGKSFTIMQWMQGKGELVCADLHEHRVGLIAKRAQEMQLPGIRTLAGDMRVYRPELGKFDRVLCDAPCSGFGVIRRKPEIKDKALSEMERLPEIQYKLLETAAQYCGAGGMLLYSTCTLNPAENDEVAARFAREHPEFLPGELPGLLGGGATRTILDEFGADGFYLALFCRKE